MRVFLVVLFTLVTTDLCAQGFLDPGGPVQQQLRQPLQLPVNPLQPGGGGGAAPPNIAGCSVDQLLAPLKAAEELIRTQAEQLKAASQQLKEANEQLKNAANNAAQGQLDLIRKTAAESAKFLLSPVETLVNGIKETVKKYYDDVVETIKEWALKLVVLAGVIFGLGVAWPLTAFIRAITPRRKT